MNTQNNTSNNAISDYAILCKIQPPYYENTKSPSKVSTYQAYKKMKEERAAKFSKEKNETKKTKRGGEEFYSTVMFFG